MCGKLAARISQFTKGIRQFCQTEIFFWLKGAVARYCACTALIDSGSWSTNRNRQKRRPATMRILRDVVVFSATSRMFVSSSTISSLILESIRQRLIEDTINTVNRSLCNSTRNQPNTFTHLPRGLKFAIGSTDFVDMRVNAMNNTSTHVIKQI